MPFVDQSGSQIRDSESWNRSRNKERNWETLNQLISLRALPSDISLPVVVTQAGKRIWQFYFSIDQPGAVELDGDPLGSLLQDCVDVPMLTDLDEDPEIEPKLIPGSNVFFEVVDK